MNGLVDACGLGTAIRWLARDPLGAALCLACAVPLWLAWLFVVTKALMQLWPVGDD